MKTYGKSGGRGADLQDRKQRKNNFFFFCTVIIRATTISISPLKKRQLQNGYLKSAFLNIMYKFASVSEGMEKEICRFVSNGSCKKGFWQRFMQQFLNSPSLHFLSQQPTK